MFWLPSFSFLLCSILGVTALPGRQRATPKSDYIRDAVDAARVLNDEWYNDSNGQWQDLWWNSANVVTTLGGLAQVDSDYKTTGIGIVEGVFSAAKGSNGGTWLNNFYDDEGWWALAWIKVYDLTEDSRYLSAAEDIFGDLKTGLGATCGGQWWDKDHTSSNTINNALFLSVAASLANRVGNDKQAEYRDAATSQVDWLLSKGLDNSNNTFVDGLSLDDCSPEGDVFTYNQGAMIGGLVEVNKLTGNSSYLDKAAEIAQGAMDHLTSDGILTELSIYPDADQTAAQFKGVFVRNLVSLQSARPNSDYIGFLQNNADALWAQDRIDAGSNEGQLGSAWQGPVTSVSAASQSSALDCLVAAAAVSS